MNTIITYLKQLELSEVEATLYLTLLQTGPISVRDLAVATKMKRTTVYLYIDQLINKGLIMKLVKGARKLIAANPPEDLKSLVEKELESAKTLQSTLPNVLKTIHTTLPEYKSFEDAEIKYYKGKLAIKKIYDEALSGDNFRLYVNLSQLETLLFPNSLDLDYDMFETALAKNKKLKIYEIISDEPQSVNQFNLEQTAKKASYFYKFMPKNVGITTPGILLYDDKVAMINGGETISSVVLHDPDYYSNSVKLFDFIWNVLPEPKGDA